MSTAESVTPELTLLLNDVRAIACHLAADELQTIANESAHTLPTSSEMVLHASSVLRTLADIKEKAVQQ